MIARAFRQLLALLGIALVPALVSGAIQLKWQPRPAPLQDGEVRAETVRAWGAKVLFVDARPDATRDAIPGAVRLNAEEWERLVPRFLDAWDPDAHVVVVGEALHPDDALAVALRLREELKLGNVSVLQGGREAWPGR